MKDATRKALDKKFAEAFDKWRKNQDIENITPKKCRGEQFSRAMRIIEVNPDEVCAIDEWCRRLSASVEDVCLTDDWWNKVFSQARKNIVDRQKPLYVSDLAEIVKYNGRYRYFVSYVIDNCKLHQMRCFRTQNGYALEEYPEVAS